MVAPTPIFIGRIEYAFFKTNRYDVRQQVFTFKVLDHLDNVYGCTDCICSHDTGHMWEASSPHLLQNL